MRKMTEKNQYLYDAFISYRHTEPDKFAAETLHKELESFKLPRNILKKMGEEGKTRINRVFRDRDELPIASNLADPITDALEASEFLIVICSPRLPESLWCRKEIETFMQLHDREHVLAVLVEGEPDDSFPEELRFCEERKVNSDGTVVINRIPVEPLAADVRGKNRREIRRKIKEEVVRLAAPMFDCAYDELKQRHRERRIRKILTAAAVGSAICFIFGAISTMMALRIHGQNIEISEKSNKIEEQSEEIKLQYWKALENYAVQEAENALNLLDQGDRIEAIKTAREILPESLEEQEIPYTYKAEYALSKSLGVYDDGETTLADFMLKHNTNVSAFKVSPERNRLLTSDDASTIYVWDLLTGELLLENHDYSRALFINDDVLEFLDNDTFFYMGNEQGVVFDIPAGNISEFELESGYRIKADKQGKQLAIFDSREVRIMDVDTRKIKYSYTAEEKWSIGSEYAFSPDGRHLAFSVSKREGNKWDSEWEGTQVLVMDCSSGEITHQYPMKQEMIDKLLFDDDVLYVTNYEDFITSEKNSYINAQLQGFIYSCDLSSYSGINWVYADETNALYFIAPAGNKDSNLLLCTSYSGVYLLDRRDGSLIGKEELGESIINVAATVNGENFFAYTRGGNIVFIRNNNGILEAVNFAYQFQCNSNNLQQFDIGSDGILVTHPYNSTNVTVFSGRQGQRFETVVKNEDYLLTAEVSPDGQSMVLSDSKNKVDIYDVQTKELRTSFETANYISKFVFVGKEADTIAALTVGALRLYDSSTGSSVAEYELEGYDLFYLGEYYEQVISAGTGNLIIYDTLSGREIKRLETDMALSGGSMKAVNRLNGHLAVAFGEEGVVRLYDSGDMSVLDEIPVNAAYMYGQFFDPIRSELYVVYKDRSVQIYGCAEDGKWDLRRAYASFDEEVEEVIDLGDGSRVILKGSTESYLLKDGEVVARLPHFKAFGRIGEEKTPVLFAGNRTTLRKVPVYDYNMLMEEAKKY